MLVGNGESRGHMGQIEQQRYTCWGAQRISHNVGRLETSWRNEAAERKATPGVRAAKIIELGARKQ